MATRRALLGRVAAALGVLACRGLAAQPAEGAAYVAVETSALSGLSRARFLAAEGRDVATIPLNMRAHGLAQRGDTLAVFPRRPGTRFAVVDLARLEVRAVVEAPPSRHFYGHGAFAKDGRTLLVTENDLDTLDGAIGLYDLGPPARRLGAVSLPRPGPHDIRRVPDTDRFHIALGGLRTHPDYGRTPLNLDGFASEVATLDLARGGIDPMGPWDGTDGVSLRHLAEDGAGRLYVGGQRQDGRAGGVLWLVEDGRVRALDPGDRLGGYASSVAAHGDRAVVTSKETGVALVFDGGRLTSSRRMEGASAAALGPGLCALSGHARLDLGGPIVAAGAGHEFDNHGAAIEPLG